MSQLNLVLLLSVGIRHLTQKVKVDMHKLRYLGRPQIGIYTHHRREVLSSFGLGSRHWLVAIVLTQKLSCADDDGRLSTSVVFRLIAELSAPQISRRTAVTCSAVDL